VCVRVCVCACVKFPMYISIIMFLPYTKMFSISSHLCCISTSCVMMYSVWYLLRHITMSSFQILSQCHYPSLYYTIVPAVSHQHVVLSVTKVLCRVVIVEGNFVGETIKYDKVTRFFPFLIENISKFSFTKFVLLWHIALLFFVVTISLQ